VPGQIADAPARRVPRRFAILPRLGLAPSATEVVRRALDEAFERGTAAGRHRLDALDAGCGRRSQLVPYRRRIGRLVGADLHPPAPGAVPELDAFVAADLCTDAEAFAAGEFDIALASFTVEHFAEPAAAFRNIRSWLRPGGTLVISTVNRRHPFVGAYLGLAPGPRGRLQRLVKASAADAHPLVGACNDPASLIGSLRDAGFVEVRVTPVCHLARAWGRHFPTYLVGLLGDLVTVRLPGRRSTLVISARRPSRERAAPEREAA
jgi:SAM-dependent methyltransferase